MLKIKTQCHCSPGWRMLCLGNGLPGREASLYLRDVLKYDAISVRLITMQMDPSISRSDVIVQTATQPSLLGR